MSSFYGWLNSKDILAEQSWIGDLARDAKGDQDFKKYKSSITKLHEYLGRQHACKEAHQALDEAWAIFHNIEVVDYTSKFYYGDEDEEEDDAVEVEVTTTISIRRSLPPKVRFDVFKRDHYRCRICGRGAIDETKLEVDHIRPVSKGGSDDIENLWTLCFECNRGKAGKGL